MTDELNDKLMNELSSAVAAALTPAIRQLITTRDGVLLVRWSAKDGVEVAIERSTAALARAFGSKDLPGVFLVPDGAADVDAPKRRRSGRGAPRGERRAALSLEAVKAALAGKKDGLRSEILRKEMGLKNSDRRSLAGILRKGVESGDLVQEGERRATTYALKK
jgi:hypothetical protein